MIVEVEIQKIVFPKKNVCDCEDLYYRKIGFPSSREIYSDKIIFHKNQRVAFDTYFNSLSILKWSKYTYADSNFKLKLTLKGSFNVKLVHMFLECGGKVNYEILETKKVSCEKQEDFIFQYVTDNPWGCVAFIIESLTEGGIFYGGAYLSDITDDLRKVKLGIGICTFKREEYVKNNIANINTFIFENSDCELKNNLEIFISDNAQTLGSEFENNAHVHLVENKNSGGSGGFTRCMIEALRYNEKTKEGLTHLILMDDDVKFDPVSLLRTYKLLVLLKPEYIDAFIGGAMFKMSDPNIQHASGEYWHGERCESFVETYNSNRNMIDIKNILENENLVNANYQAWWYCAIPMSVINYENLSLPFFIKSDDIEYSIRNLKSLILLNGIAVWHESFESKYSAPNEYYTVRNYLVTASVHNADVTKENILFLLKSYFKHYACNFKYLEIKHFCNAINDFLKGVDYFKSIDLAELHKKIMPMNYKILPKEQLPVKISDAQYFNDISFHEEWSKLKKKFAKLTVNGLLLPSKGYSVLGMWGGSYEQTYRKKFIVRYEINSKKGFVLKRSIKKFIKCVLLYNKTKSNIQRKFNKVKAEFFNRKEELWNYGLWSKQLKID